MNQDEIHRFEKLMKQYYSEEYGRASAALSNIHRAVCSDLSDAEKLGLILDDLIRYYSRGKLP